MIVIIVIGILIFVALFSLFSNLARLPSIKSGMSYSVTGEKKQKTGKLDLLSKKLAFLIPVSKLREINVSRILKSAGMNNLTPREYISGYVTRTAIILIIAVLLGLIWWPLSLPLLFFAWYTWINKRNYAYRLGIRRRKSVEKELPRFVSYIASRVKTSHNMIQIMTDYKANYNSTLTEEIAFTIADMKTGNQEQAVMNLQDRINSPLMTELCRGLVSAMRGDDVVLYFETFTSKLMTLWNQRLKEEALKKEPKISKMSYVLLACGFISVFVVLISVAIRSVTMLQQGGAM